MAKPKGIRSPSEEEAAQNAPTLLGFGGNAWNAKATALTYIGFFLIAISSRSTTHVRQVTADRALRR